MALIPHIRHQLSRVSILFQGLCFILILMYFSSLSEYIQWHLDNKEHEPIAGLDELPPGVQLKHVINAWQTSVELWDSYHEKRDSAAT